MNNDMEPKTLEIFDVDNPDFFQDKTAYKTKLLSLRLVESISYS